LHCACEFYTHTTLHPRPRAPEGRAENKRHSRERTPTTSRHKKVPAPAPQPTPAAAPGRGPEFLRRALLGLATALIAARALLPAEDVGLLEPGANPLGLVITLLWLVGVAAWAAWRIWSRQLDWYGGLVEAGLLLFLLFSFIATAFGAPYQHPAWVVSWEWAGLLAAFFLVRQIARTPADQRAILAALLATGVTLAVQSLYQQALPERSPAPLPGLPAEGLPRLRCQMLATFGNAPPDAFPAQLGPAALAQENFPGNLSLPSLAVATSDRDPTLFERFAARNNLNLETGEPALPLDLRPAPEEFATFSNKSHLAACLVLLLPALVGCVLAAWLGGVPRWQLGVALVYALLVALALALTQVRSAILPCLLVGAAASVLAWRYASHTAGPSRRLLLLLALAGPAALLVLAFVLQQRGGSGLDDLRREWSAAWAMIRDHPWLGVGPGNYGRMYPRYMAIDAPAFARQPSCFVLEVWATMGLPALAALALALINFFRRTLTRVPTAQTENQDQGTRWEFYEGGMVGLIVGFVLRALPLGPEAITAEAVAAVVRAVVWFAVFALIHGIRWGGATRVLACTAGVAALLLHLAVSGGFFVPGVALPLVILAALALNGLPERPVPVGRQFAGRVLPLAFATAAALMCLLQLVQPLVSAAASARTARSAGQKYLDLRSGVSRTLEEGKEERLRNRGEVLKHIVQQFEGAVQDDPANARYWVDLANWYGTFYEWNGDEEMRQRGLKYALAAQQRDRFGEAGYYAEFRLHQLAAGRASTLDGRLRMLDEAVKPLFRLVPLRRFDAQLHYRLAAALAGVGDREAATRYAQYALEYDAAAPTDERRLTEPQRKQVRRFLEAP
jgi:O-antigen ligase